MGKVFNKYTPSFHAPSGPSYPKIDARYVDEIYQTSLTIVDHSVDPDIVTLSCRAMHDDAPAGFELSLPRVCYAGLSGDAPRATVKSGATLRPGAVFTHSGPESETFTRALTGGLGLPVAPARYDQLHDDIAFSAIHLSAKDIELAQTRATFRLIFEAASNARLYWEARLIVDLPLKTVRLAEQCASYRAAMAATFCKSWGPERTMGMQHLA